MAKPAPKKPPATAPAPAPVEGEQLETVSTGEEAAAVTIAAAAPDFSADEAELGEDQASYRWHLSRAIYRGGLGAKREWETCTSYPAGVGALTADVIRADWGPGTYFAQLRPAPGTGSAHGGVKKTRVFNLAAPVGPAGTVGPGVSSLEAFMTKVLDQQQRGFEQLAATLARPAAPALDPQAMLDLALRMAERMSPKRESESAVDQVLGLFERFEKFRGGGGKDWTDLASQGLDALKPLVDVAVTKLGGGSAPAPAAGNNGAAAPKLEAGGPSMLQLANFLQRQVRYLTGKARSGASASLYAEVLLDNLPPGVTPAQVLELLKRPRALDDVFNLLPAEDRAAAQSVRPWFEELVTELHGFLGTMVNGAGGAPEAGDKGGEVDDTPAV